MSNVKGVESKGAALIVGSTWSARAIECEASSAMISSGVNPPPSANRAMIESTESCGSGISPSGAGAVALGLPARNSSLGAPGQLEIPTAPANWIRSPAETWVWLARKGRRASTLSDIPRLAKKLGSTSGKMSMDPSAPPPAGLPWLLRDSENAIASSGWFKVSGKRKM